MKERLLLTTIFAVSICMKIAFSQQSNSGLVENIAAGSRFPQYFLRGIEHSTTTSLMLGSHNKKWIILDFWSEWCGSCIKSFPKMNNIQREFADQAVVIMVGTYLNTKSSNLKSTKRLFNEISEKYNLDLSAVYDNEIANKLAVTRLPDILIVDPNGIVRSRSAEITSESIRSIMNGQNTGYDLFPDAAESMRRESLYKRKLPLLINGNGGSDSSFIYRSAVIPDNNSTPMSREIYDKGRLEIISSSLKDLYKLAHWGYFSWSIRTSSTYSDSITKELYGNYNVEPILEIDDSTSFFSINKTERRYSYSLIYPPNRINGGAAKRTLASSSFLRNHMQQDLAATFGYSARVEVRTMPSYRLIAPNIKISKIRSMGNEYKFSEPNGRYQGAAFQKAAISDIIMYLIANSYGYDSAIPIIDSTNLKDKIDIRINGTTFDELCESLRTYGFDIIKEGIPMKCLIIYKLKNQE